MTFAQCVQDAHSHIFELLELKGIVKPGEDFDIGDLFDEEEKYSEFWNDADANYWLGYMEGVADTMDMTVRQLLDDCIDD